MSGGGDSVDWSTGVGCGDTVGEEGEEEGKGGTGVCVMSGGGSHTWGA